LRSDLFYLSSEIEKGAGWKMKTDVLDAKRRTVCLVALFLLASLVDRQDLSWCDKQANLEAANGWQKVCYKSLTNGKPLSAAADRVINDVIRKWCKYLGITGKDNAIPSAKIAAAYVAVSHLITDALAVGGGLTSRTCWRKLGDSSFYACKDVIRAYPEAEEEGYSLYEKICVA
jgi:hypothetical protein